MLNDTLQTFDPKVYAVILYMTIEKMSFCVICLALASQALFSISPIGTQASERKPAYANADKPGSDSAGTTTGAPVYDSVSRAGGVTMRVLWTVSGYVLGKDSSWSENEAKALLFKPLDITESAIIFNNRTCNGIKFERTMVTTAEFLAKKSLTAQDLGIREEKVQIIKTTCDIPGFQEYIRLGDGRLIAPINGVFFFFEPAVTR